MKHTLPEDAPSSSSATSSTTDQSHVATSSSSSSALPGKPGSVSSAAAQEDLTIGSRDGGGAQQSVTIERRGDYSAVYRWTVHSSQLIKGSALWSKYFEVGGYDCRLLIYPKGDSQALPGYISIYLQILDPGATSSSKWDCFASYRLAIVNVADDSKTVHRDSWHRFSNKKKSHGWCDFTPSTTVLDPKLGYLLNGDSVLITADILILNESINFTRDNNELQLSASSSSMTSSSVVVGPVSDVLSGKFTWKVHNFSLFKEMIKTQKIMSPVFPAGECNLRVSVYQSLVNGVEYLSMCLESKDTDKTMMLSDKSCWCLFRMSVLNQRPGSNHMHRDSYGRFAADNKSGDNTSLGWNDYMKMSDFIGPDSGFLVDDTAVFSTSFHVIKELSSFSKNGALIAGRIGSGVKKSDGHMGKFTWRIENFTRLKDLLKKRKITGLCIKSRRFQVGNRDCRLIVYPRGQSQPPCHLSLFLEVTDSRNTSSDWSCFVSHRLSVVNQKMEEKSVSKESQNRYSKAAKDWGWREFVTLTSLFDQDSGFLVQDTVVFSAEVLVLKETSIMQDLFDYNSEWCSYAKRRSFTWKVENFLSFKEIMETRKIFSKFFQAGGCELRIGVYESFETVCVYLESDQAVGGDPDKNFWVKYKMAVVNQKDPAKTEWKESSICTKTWNNSVLQFMKVSDILEAASGFLVRDTVVFVCEILDCCPWFDFADLKVLASDDDQDALTTDPDELVDSEDSEGISGDEEDIFDSLLSRAGFHLTYGDNPSQPQLTLREKLLKDAGAVAGFLTGLRLYLDDPVKVKRLLLPTKVSGSYEGNKQAIIDLLWDIMVECCQPSEGSCAAGSPDVCTKRSLDCSGDASPLECDRENGPAESAQFPVGERLDSADEESSGTCAVQSSDPNDRVTQEKALHGQPIFPPETSAVLSENPSFRSKTKWPEQSEELLGLIVNSLRSLDRAVPQGYHEPRRCPQSAHKICIVLDKAPKHLQADIVALVPKLVEPSEHPLAACALLERLQKPDAEPAFRMPVFDALSQLDCGSEVWKRVLFQSIKLLADSNDEPLSATIDFIFKAAAKCQHLPEAVRSVRVRLKNLGPQVSTCVLDVLRKTVNSRVDVAETILRDIDCDGDLDDSCSSLPCGLSLFGEHGTAPTGLNVVDEQAFPASCYFSDIYILVELLSIPCLAVEASQTFERAVARGAVDAKSVALVLEKRASQRWINFSIIEVERFLCSDAVAEGNASESFGVQRHDFTPVLGLAETLALSRDACVKEFGKLLYLMLFRCYADESHRGTILKGLVGRATSATDNDHEVDLDLDILVTLASEEQEIAKLVLSMMREVAKLANVNRSALWHQLCASKDEIIRFHEEKKAKISNMAKEKAIVTQKLSESEATSIRLKSEMRAEMDRLAREKKELAEKIQGVESQLEWLHSERDDEIAKLSAEKKALQDRVHGAEAQLSLLKSHKHDELKKVVKEKNVLAERLKSAEAARKRFDEELRRYATENITREEVLKSLEDEVRRLTQTVGQTEERKREKEEQVSRCEAYIDGMEPKLQACQQYIHNLEASLQEEMSRHAPLYGVGLDDLSMEELETLASIHEEGLRRIHALKQRKGSPAGSPIVSPHTLPPHPHIHGLFSPASPPLPVVLPPSLIPNGAHSNGHVNGAAGAWYKHT